MISNGDKVRVIFKNNVYLDGIVVDAIKLDLKLKDGFATNISIEDILYVKLFKENIEEKEPDDLIYEDAKNLAELRIEQNKIEKEDLATRMKDLSIKEPTKVNYGTPSFSTFKVSK